jgi:hypothetical protein
LWPTYEKPSLPAPMFAGHGTFSTNLPRCCGAFSSGPGELAHVLKQFSAIVGALGSHAAKLPVARQPCGLSPDPSKRSITGARRAQGGRLTWGGGGHSLSATLILCLPVEAVTSGHRILAPFRRGISLMVRREAKTPARSKATGGGPFAKACFALGTRRAELILGLSARSPMPRGRQLGTARWCHAVHTLPLS